MIPYFIGRIVTLVTTSQPDRLLADSWHLLLGMALVLLLVRPLTLMAQNLVMNQAIAANVANLVRWQSHWHVARQSWAFFQNDFAGRIASKVMQTGPAIRESLVSLITGVWYILVYGTSAVVLLASADPRLAVPILLWFAGYLILLRIFVPRMRDRSHDVSEARSVLTGRIVDTYTNILTVKLFARGRQEDAYVREAFDEHTGLFHASLRLNTLFGFLPGDAQRPAGDRHRRHRHRAVDARRRRGRHRRDGAAARLADRQHRRLGRHAGDRHFRECRRGAGRHERDRPPDRADRPAERAARSTVPRGEIEFDGHPLRLWPRDRPDRRAHARPCGRARRSAWSAAPAPASRPWSTCCCASSTSRTGRILIDGQDIAEVTQESLRAQISVVTQDTSLLHRSIRDNIRYGRPGAGEAEIVAAAKLAHAHEFILELEDWKGRRGYDAQVGERGVKLSGGQRQRVAIARVILKNAPILVLDEATSALDSEVEAAIQASLGTLMAGKTVIAIAHRLSTIAQMDRLVVLDRGRIVEQGTHDELLRAWRPLRRPVAAAIRRLPRRRQYAGGRVTSEMPNREPESRHVVCARCGTAFDCQSGGDCWCAAEPVRLPVPIAGSKEDCVCRDCLRAAASRAGI